MFHLKLEEEFMNYHDLQEIMDMNDLTDLDVLRILIEGGHVEIPKYVGYNLPTEDDNEQ